jgi:hypothetical protein
MSETANDEPAQIDNELVAQTFGQLGDSRYPRGDAPEMRYINIAAYNRYEDVHSGLFIDSENPGQLLYGWTNKQRSTWKITDTGERVIVDDADVDAPENVEDARTFAQEWIDVIVDQLRYDAENQKLSRSISDEIQITGKRKVKLRDVDERIATFDITLE